MEVNKESTETKCTKHAVDLLVGKKIVRVEYMSVEDREIALWYDRPLMIYLDDGSLLIPMKDDEGNEIERILVGISLVPDSWVDSTV